jgi:hypothetical protein
VNGERTHFPPGVPATYSAMERLGVARSSTFVALNLLLLAIGLFCAYGMLRRDGRFTQSQAMLACILAATSAAVVKHSAIALSDVPFFGAFMLSLYFLSVAQPLPLNKKWRMLLLATLSIILAGLLRSIAIVLLPAFVAAILPPDFLARISRRIGRLSAGQLASAIAIILLALFGSIMFAAHSKYVSEMLSQYREGSVAGMMAFIVKARLIDLGCIIVNVPARVARPSTIPILGVSGLLLLGIVLWALWHWRERITPMDACVFFYFLILLVWPYPADPRFWVPVTPILAGYVILAAAYLPPPLRRLSCAALVCYLTFGLGALFYSDRISLKGREAALHGTVPDDLKRYDH